MKVITHPGKFHADDVACVALLNVLFPDNKVEVERLQPTQTELDNKNIYVLDIGGEYSPDKLNFDHHQFESGDHRCALSLLTEYFVVDYPWLQSEVMETFVRQIAEQDTTGTLLCGEQNSWSSFIAGFNPLWNEPNSRYFERFQNAVNVSIDRLKQIQQQYYAQKQAEQLIQKAYIQGSVIFLDDYVPWKSCVLPEQVHYACYPSLRGGYNVESLDSNQWPLPFDRNEDFGCTFIHSNKFISAFNNLQNAEIACKHHKLIY